MKANPLFSFRIRSKLLVQHKAAFVTLITSFGATLGLSAFAAEGALKQITILGTNDIHGHVEENQLKDGRRIGGLVQWAATARAIRQGVESQGGGVLLLDGGDQFQGTLLSNYDEGALVIDMMSEMGYDAVVPGNHDYDFGPLGWLEDQVIPGAEGDSRGALRRLKQRAKFPFLSANTYFSRSLRDVVTGEVLPVMSKGCALRDSSSAVGVDWSRAERLDLVEPYRIVTVASGVRVAVIGIDHEETATMTTLANVSDLCFRDEAEAYLSVRRELEGKADIFVMVIHGGNIQQDQGLTELVKRIRSAMPDAIDAVVGGHTHSINRDQVDGVPLIQSGAHGERFGRIDLYFDSASKKVLSEKTRFNAGIPIFSSVCPEETAEYCRQTEEGLSYENQLRVLDPGLLSRIQSAKSELSGMADRVLGESSGTLTRNRTLESSLSNAMTDSLREVTESQIALLNTGGLRADLPNGPFSYAQLFEVLPFNNRAVVVGELKFELLKRLLLKSIQTCGAYGALLPSGIRVEFSRDCKSAQGKTDPNAKLLRIELVGGDSSGQRETLYETHADGRVSEVSGDRTFRVATLDFLAMGGSGYAEFKESQVTESLGILREILAEKFARTPARFQAQLDGRFKEMRVRD